APGRHATAEADQVRTNEGLTLKTRAAVATFVMVALVCPAEPALAQAATVLRNVNLRPGPSTRQPAIRLLRAGEGLALVSATLEAGFYRVRTADGQEGWVWSRSVRITAPGTPPPAAPARGSASQTGCGDGLWKHVYSPSRLLVKQDCLTVTGVIVDATAGQP